jgi:mono/diheme cytochrome c family protein
MEKVMKYVVTIVAVMLLTALGVTGFAYSGLHDISASTSHSGLTNWLLSTTSHASIKRYARSVQVPNLEDESLKLAGINDFDSMCASCHGAPGREQEAMGKGLNPPAPDLAEEAADMTFAELFWVTKNGIRMTGMPAWGATHDDSSIWPVVAFMKELPGLDGPAYQAMLESASGHGHHAEDATTDDHSDEESEASPDSNVHIHDDGSEHVHEQQAETVPADDHDDVPHEHNDD